MEQLPKDIEILILLNLKLSDLRNACMRNRRMHQICSSNSFWIVKYKKDFPNQIFDMENARQEYMMKYRDVYNKNLTLLTHLLISGTPNRLVRDVFNHYFNIQNFYIFW